MCQFIFIFYVYLNKLILNSICALNRHLNNELINVEKEKINVYVIYIGIK